MSAISPTTIQTGSTLPLTPGTRQSKRQAKIANLKQQVQQTASSVDQVHAKLIAENSSLKTENSKLKERAKVFTRRFAEYIELSKSNLNTPEIDLASLEADIKSSDIDSESSENNSEALNTESSDSESSEVETSDVQHPTLKDMISHLAGIKDEIDTFTKLNERVDTLRNKAQICKYELVPTSSVAEYEVKLEGFTTTFYELKELYVNQWESITEIAVGLTKVIAEGQNNAKITDEDKKKFSAIFKKSLPEIRKEEESYNKALSQCVTMNSHITSMLENTARRMENARDDLNAIDIYIHTTNSSNQGYIAAAVNTAKYITGSGKKITRVFDRKQKKIVVTKPQVEVPKLEAPKEEPKAILVNKDEIPVAETLQEEVKAAEVK